MGCVSILLMAHFAIQYIHISNNHIYIFLSLISQKNGGGEVVSIHVFDIIAKNIYKKKKILSISIIRYVCNPFEFP